MPVQAGTFVDYRQINREAQEVAGRDAAGDLAQRRWSSDLSAAQMQLVETAKALALESQVLLLDEPTASITPHEVTFLFNVLRDLRDRGVAILFVTHKLEEVMELCDRVTVLRDGHNAASGEMIAGLDRDQLITWMIGRTPGDHRAAREASSGAASLRWKLRNSVRDSGTQDVSFKLHRGEVLGLYGLVGAGRTELAHALIGAQQDHGRRAPGRRQAGAPEKRLDRHDQVQDRLREREPQDGRPDPVAQHPLQRVDHRSGSRIARAARLGERAQEERSVVQEDVEKLDVKTPSLEQRVMNLSGGNQQKVSIAKWLAAKADILIFDEPTIGIDIKTKYALHDLIWDLAGAGQGRDAHLQRHARDDPPGRPHPGHEGQPHHRRAGEHATSTIK